jgi:hypothetical protein
MRLTRDDVGPVLAIIVGGALGVVAIAGVVVPGWYQDGVAAFPQYDRQVVDAEIEIVREPRSERVQPIAFYERVEALLAQQRDMVRDVSSLPIALGLERTLQIEQLRERKDQMDADLRSLPRELEEAAGVDGPEVGRMWALARTIREAEVADKIRYSRHTIEQWKLQDAITLEASIEADLEAARDQILATR